MQISDDGVGFDFDQLTDMREVGRGYGLLNMKERITLIGGRCSVDPEPGKGTTVTAIVPF